MTDIEEYVALLDKFGIIYTVAVDLSSVIIGDYYPIGEPYRKDPKHIGYPNFICEMYFNADGKFTEYGCLE